MTAIYSTVIVPHTMTAGKSYQQINVPEGALEFSLPKGFQGPIRPGTFKGVTKIRFNDEFVCELEPGVITDEVVTLILGKGYRHKLGPNVLPASTKVYVYADNRDFTPTDRSFALYITHGTGEMIHFYEDDEEEWTIDEHPTHRTNPMSTRNDQFIEVVMMGIKLWTIHVTPKVLVIAEPACLASVETVIEPVVESVIESVSESVSEVQAMHQELAQANLKIDALTVALNQGFSDLKKLILATSGM